MISKHPFLKDYDLSPLDKVRANRIVSTVTNKFAKTATTPISKLMDILNDPAKYEHKRYVIKGYIVDFNQSSLKQIVKKMSNQKVLGFDDKADKVDNYLYHFVMNVKDASIEDQDRGLNVYVLTSEGDQHLFDLWGMLPTPSETEKWKKISASTSKEFEKRFKDLAAEDTEIRVVVELHITNTQKAFFKMYDTIFL